MFIYSVIKKCYLQGNWWENGTPGIEGTNMQSSHNSQTHDSGRGEQRERRNTLEIKDTTTRVNMVRRAGPSLTNFTTSAGSQRGLGDHDKTSLCPVNVFIGNAKL